MDQAPPEAEQVLNGLFTGWMFAGKKEIGIKLLEDNLHGWIF